jgi:hypothetical protein
MEVVMVVRVMNEFVMVGDELVRVVEELVRGGCYGGGVVEEMLVMGDERMVTWEKKRGKENLIFFMIFGK